MIPALIAAAATVVAVTVTVFGQWLASRNDRRTVLLELEILSKMRPGTKEARDMRAVMGARTMTWRRRLSYKVQTVRFAALPGGASFCFIVLNVLARAVLGPDQALKILREQLAQARYTFVAFAFTSLVLAYVTLLMAVLPRRRRRQILNPVKTYKKAKQKRAKSKAAALTPEED